MYTKVDISSPAGSAVRKRPTKKIMQQECRQVVECQNINLVVDVAEAFRFKSAVEHLERKRDGQHDKGDAQCAAAQQKNQFLPDVLPEGLAVHGSCNADERRQDVQDDFYPEQVYDGLQVPAFEQNAIQRHQQIDYSPQGRIQVENGADGRFDD